MLILGIVITKSKWISLSEISDSQIREVALWRVAGKYLDGKTSVETAEWVIAHRHELEYEYQDIQPIRPTN